MSDKPVSPPGAFFAIPDIPVATVDGPDAVRFAQAQFMNDVATLAPGHWQWNGWLTPKGRVVALFALVKHATESLLLLPLAGEPPAALLPQLQRYVFRSKLTLRLRTDLAVAGAFAPASTARADRSAGDPDAADGLELDFGTTRSPRTLRVGGDEAAPDPSALARWRAFDLAHGLPRLPPDQAGKWTPQQLSLDRLRAYSVKKGCYPGQEIVARTHFLGQAKRGLVRLTGPAASAPGEVLPGPAAAAAQLGQLVWTEGGEGLAVMPLDAGSGPFASAGGDCARQPLLDGLAR